MFRSPGRTEPHSRTPGLAFGAAMVALAMWSGSAIANKVAVGSMSGLTVGVLRSLVAGTIAAVMATALRLPAPVTGRDRALLVGSGLASFAVWPVLVSVGIEGTTASHTAIIMALIPVFTVLIAHLVERRLPAIEWWIGGGMAFAATALLVTLRDTSSTTGGVTLGGDLTILSGTVLCAGGYVAGGRLSARIGTLATTFWGLAWSLIVVAPVFGLIASETMWTQVPLEGWLALGWLTFLSSLAGYALWFYALAKGGIARIGSLQLAMPAVGVVAASIILDEALTARIAVTTVLIIPGAWWAHRHST